MSDRTYIYIDGESHFIRSEVAWREIHDEQASLTQLRYIDNSDDRLVLVRPEAKVFWTRRMNPDVKRAIYFTAAPGGADDEHELSLSLRDFDLEPHLIQEFKSLAARRKNTLQTQQLIEKPKGVDIALAVTMLEDAHLGAFDACHLYTSDADFVPLIEKVMSKGKQVFVHGYKNGLSDRSRLLHVPDRFIDLEAMLRSEFIPKTPQPRIPDGNS